MSCFLITSLAKVNTGLNIYCHETDRQLYENLVHCEAKLNYTFKRKENRNLTNVGTAGNNTINNRFIL